MRVAVLPTGRAELLGLPDSLGRLFPGHDFLAVPKIVGTNEPFDGFTSTRLAADGPTNESTSVGKIVRQMAAELVPGRRGDTPDLFVVLDDLELSNREQPQLVIDVFRRATEQHLQSLRGSNPGLADRVRTALQARASLHLAAPMLEAWFFADPQGPTNARVPPGRLPPNWESQADPEDFLTREQDFLDENACTCTAWQALPERKQREHRPAWLCDSREHHPKAFLAWLCRDPAEKKCSRYRETHEGADALRRLDWPASLRNAEHCTYLRALVEDLADGLGEPLPVAAGGRAAPLTSHRERRHAPLLRNILGRASNRPSPPRRRRRAQRQPQPHHAAPPLVAVLQCELSAFGGLSQRQRKARQARPPRRPERDGPTRASARPRPGRNT
jgi:hypothetical protein